MTRYLKYFLLALRSHWESDIFAVSKDAQDQNKVYYFFIYAKGDIWLNLLECPTAGMGTWQFQIRIKQA